LRENPDPAANIPSPLTGAIARGLRASWCNCRAAGARLPARDLSESQPQHVRQTKSPWNFLRSFGNPGCCGWDTRAPFHLGNTPAEFTIRRLVSKRLPAATGFIFKPMKTILMKSDQPLPRFRLRRAPTRQVGTAGRWPVFAALRPGRQVAPSSLRFDATRSDKMANTARSRHASRVTRHPRAFTIVELLTVIAIIGILAAMLLPVLSRAKIVAQKQQAKVEISQIVGAIQQYDSVYGRFPVSKDDPALAGTNDFTCGGTGYDSSGVNQLWTMGITNNWEVIAILMDITTYSNGVQTVNYNHFKNPQQTAFLNAKMSGDTRSPGVGTDLVYRDPWGNPYIITMDLTYDEQCRDAFYCQQVVSQTKPSSQQGLNGLFNPDAAANGNSDNFLYHGKVMVWSAGPDRMIVTNSPTPPLPSGNLGVNKDNILSWQ
jgi:prepilin-type N-terminal cleavage/methylation domain-containing protein